ncbi:kinesin-like protein KIN-5D [Ipomoea triloba]|uniref:kinesin-like protein KIN-5D n=1 Tax=Ipomoea triloba TaxID=35885 RepID=UPI00125E541B|nr:kinesin-like protein KIN-5D [Ipomoea triloba]
MSTMHDSTSLVKDEWTMYMEKAELYYLGDTVSVENIKKEMEVVLQSCLQKAKMGAQQWNNAQRSLLNLEEVNVASVHEIVREVSIVKAFLFAVVLAVFSADAKAHKIGFAPAPSPDRKLSAAVRRCSPQALSFEFWVR